MKFKSKIFLIFFILILASFSKNCFANLPKKYFIDKSKLLLVQKPKDSWFAVDKYRHVVASAFLMGVSYNIARVEGKWNRKNAIMMGCSFSFSIGLTKEFRDYFSPKGVASFKDIVADIVGIGLGVLCFTEL